MGTHYSPMVVHLPFGVPGARLVVGSWAWRLRGGTLGAAPAALGNSLGSLWDVFGSLLEARWNLWNLMPLSNENHCLGVLRVGVRRCSVTWWRSCFAKRFSDEFLLPAGLLRASVAPKMAPCGEPGGSRLDALGDRWSVRAPGWVVMAPRVAFECFSGAVRRTFWVRFERLPGGGRGGFAGLRCPDWHCC